MMLKSCPREKELRDLIVRGGWPSAADTDPELRAHVAACRSCSELALVSGAFREARATSAATARLIPPGILWWRAQLRRREVAVESISRPLLGAQIFALAIALLAGLGFAAFQARQGAAWLSWLEEVPQNAALHWDNLFASAAADPTWTWMVVLPAFATLTLLGGVAVYLATEKQ